jgi:4-diphosphocytidyl-2-C-methyl-D-erythritol kinase
LDWLTIKSPAKINLFLDVLKKRDDGYHQIRTLMQAVDLCDQLTLQKTEKGIGISCDHPACPSDDRNLAFKAAVLLLKEEKIKGGVKIRIEKRVPVSAGLGGGSSNAAATLVGLNRLFDLGLPVDRLHQLGAQIGSDVPFFLYSGQALAKGRGEEIVPVRLYRDYWLVLVCPSLEVHSGWAYGKVKISLTRERKEVNFMLLESRHGFFDALPLFKNDLEEAVVGEYPILRQLKDVLKNSGAVKSSMSGSGPTVYGLFNRKPQAQEVARKLSQGDWQVFLTQPILLTFESLG